MTSIYSNIVSPELPHLREKTTASKPLNKQLCVIASRFIHSSNSKISISDARPADRDAVCLTFWTRPAWILLLSQRDDRWAVCSGRALNVPPHPSLSVLRVFVWVCACSARVRALLLEYTMRVCKSSAGSTASHLCKSKVFCSFPRMSLFLHILFGSLCFPLICLRPWHWPSTVSALPRRSEGKRELQERRQSRRIMHKNIIFILLLYREYAALQPAHFHLFEATLVPLPSPS